MARATVSSTLSLYRISASITTALAAMVITSILCTSTCADHVTTIQKTLSRNDA